MPSFNWRLALQSGYTPEEIQAHLDSRGLSDEALIQRQLGGKPMLPYSYGPDLDMPPPAAAPPPLMSGPPASVPGSVPQTGERRNMSPVEVGALWGEQGIQPELLPPLSLGDLAMQPVGELLNDADVAKYLLPLSMLGMVRYKRPGVSTATREAAEKLRKTPITDPIGAKGLEVKAWDYPTLGKADLLEGRTVRSDIPNQGSIGSTFDEYEVLPGVRQVPMSEFPGASPRSMFYSADDIKRAKRLAEEIKASGEINPLIVAVDPEGPYVLEGGHRLAALHELGSQSVPAQVVLDRDQLLPLPYSNRARLSELAKKKRK